MSVKPQAIWPIRSLISLFHTEPRFFEQRWKQLQSWSDTKEVVRARHHGSLASLWSLPMAPLLGGPWGTEWWRWRTCKSDQAIFDTASSGEGTYNPLERFGKYPKVKTSQDMSRLPFYLEFNMAATWQSYDVATCCSQCLQYLPSDCGGSGSEQR